ncbi:MAG: Rid family hydrolase [Longimicrobiales bacterium]
MRPLYIVALAALLCAQPLAAQAAPRIAHKPVAGRPYSAAVQVGDTYWFAGKVGNTPETQALTTGRTAAETRNIMEAFKTLMTELGLDFGDVVQATVYLVDVGDFAEMNEVYGEYFPTDPPARETVGVKLVGGAALEISFVAVKR